MALGVDQLIDFLECYFIRHGQWDDEIRLRKPWYDANTRSVVLGIERNELTVSPPGMAVDSAACRLPLAKMEGGAFQIIDYVEKELRKLNAELNANSEVKPDENHC